MVTLGTIGGLLQNKMTEDHTLVPKLQAAQAILILDNKYIMQLRDDKPDIPSPGIWSLFGGMVNEGENPRKAVEREILEELSIIPPSYEFLWWVNYFSEHFQEPARSWIYWADVREVWHSHVLMEGADVRAFYYEELKTLKMPDFMRDSLKRCHHGHMDRKI